MRTVGGKSLIFLTSNILLFSNRLVGLYPKPIYRFAIKQMQRLSIIPLNGLPKYALSTMCLMMRTFYLTQRSSIHTTCTYFYILGCIPYVLYDIDFVYKTRFLKLNDCLLSEILPSQIYLLQKNIHPIVQKLDALKLY